MVRLFELDARELLAALPDRSVDLIVTDPPYTFDRGHSDRFGEWFHELDDDQWPAIFVELRRVLAVPGHCYVFSDHRARPILDRAAAVAGFQVRAPLVWDKQTPGLSGAGCAWRSQYELIGWYASKGAALEVVRADRGNVLRHPRVRGGYPTEKPVPVLRELIARASRPGAVVLDPFCGSGNVGAAARELGRRALLADVDTSTAGQRLRVAPSTRYCIAG